MKRRKALTVMAGGFGATLLGTGLLVMGCSPKNKNSGLFSEEDIHLLDEFGETILPRTIHSPGAKSTKIGLFMTTIATDCYAQKDKDLFIKGLQELAGIGFLDLTTKEREEVLMAWEKEAATHSEVENPHFYKIMKELVVWGYFTSEIGLTKALRYNPIPGKYIGCVPYTVGDRAWANY